MEVIKKKIASLKNDLDAKDEEINELRSALKHEKIEREKAENEAAAQTRKLTLLEEGLDRAEENVARLTAQVNSTETERDEAERRLRSLENMEASSSEKCYDQENELKRAKQITDETERKYDEVVRKIAVLEADLEKAEERADEYQNRYAKTDAENIQLATSIRSFEASDEMAAEKEANMEEQLVKFGSKHAENERNLENVQAENNTLRKTVDELEDLCEQLKSERDQANEELAATMRELGEI